MVVVQLFSQFFLFFFFQAEDGIRDWSVTGVQTCALPISLLEACGDWQLKAAIRVHQHVRLRPPVLDVLHMRKSPLVASGFRPRGPLRISQSYGDSLAGCRRDRIQGSVASSPSVRSPAEAARRFGS